MDLLSGIFSAFGLSASAGLNAYIPLLVVALLARFTGLIKLTPPWDLLTSWWIIGLLLVLSFVEFFADKVPAINHVNDVIQTFIRPTAGAILFAASAETITDIHPILALAAGVLVAGGVHAAKSVVVRPAVTATTAGVGNVPVSVLEDILATIVSFMAVVIPVLLAILAILFSGLILWFFWQRSHRRRNLIR